MQESIEQIPPIPNHEPISQEPFTNGTLTEKQMQGYDLVIELRGDWLTAIFALFKISLYRLDRPSLQIANND